MDQSMGQEYRRNMNLALDLNPDHEPQTAPEHESIVYLHKGEEGERFVFLRGRLLTTYEHSDLYARNYILVQLFLTHRVSQKCLSEVFGLTVPHISLLVGKYRREGSAGIEDNTVVRVRNNQKIKGRIEDYLVRSLDVDKADRPTYQCLSDQVKKKFKVSISRNRIANWWREYRNRREDLAKLEASKPQQSVFIEEALGSVNEEEKLPGDDSLAGLSSSKSSSEADAIEEGDWKESAVAGSFILYAMLCKSQFLNPFLSCLKGIARSASQQVERVMLTLFFMHALRLKSIEQTKHLSEKHFAPLVLGAFCRGQTLRYAIDNITDNQHFDEAVSLHYKNMGMQTRVGDEIYYTDGHFSCYYGKQSIPKGYDARRKQVCRGRNTIYLHNSLGCNILSFESPTNTTLNNDIKHLLGKMEHTFGDVREKTLLFDRGGYSADCFTALHKKGMYFATYLKHRNKISELDLDKFVDTEISIDGEVIKNRIYEKAIETKRYGNLRVILFIGKRGKQIPVITTNPYLSSEEIVARLQKRWVEENGFKYMSEHYNIDLLTTYKTEEAPDKLLERVNPDRKAINQEIALKKKDIARLKSEYSSQLMTIQDKDSVSILDFEKQEEKRLLAIKTAEMELGLLELKREDIPSKVTSNLKDESVISRQKRRLFINVIKSMNYNCEKWLQDLFCQCHPKKDETLSLIRSVLKLPGRIRACDGGIEVELDRLDSGVQANSLDEVLKKLKQYNYLRLPDGRTLDIWQSS